MTPTAPHVDGRETPADGWGLGYVEFSLREDIELMMKFVGFEEMRRRVAEMINDIAEQKS